MSKHLLPTSEAPYGYDVWTHTEVVPKPAPSSHTIWRWLIGPVSPKQHEVTPGPGRFEAPESEITMQLTADQQVALSISGEDKYGNTVEVTGDTVWSSSDESIVTVDSSDPKNAVAIAVGPVGSAAVTVTNDVDQDGTGDFIGSVSIDVVAGKMADIIVSAAEPVDKPS